MNTEQKIEAILFYKNEPLTHKELAKILEVDIDVVRNALNNLKAIYQNKGIVLIETSDTVAFGTHPDLSEMFEKMQKEELSRELGRAGLETLSIILYKGPVARREIDHIRGVNSGFIVRNLLIRGLIERVDPSTTLGAGRSFSYRPTLALLKHLGVTSVKDLPEYGTALQKMNTFIATEEKDANE